MAKVSRSELLRQARELGIHLPEDEFSRLLDRARAADDPLLVLREAAGTLAGMEAAASAPRPPSPVPCPPSPALSTLRLAAPVVVETSVVEVSHVQLFFRDEPYNRARLSQLLEGLASENAKLKPRMPGELPRPVKSHADALKWLLENLAPPA